MEIKIACLKKACLERKFKTGDKFWLGRGRFWGDGIDRVERVERVERFGAGLSFVL